MDATAAVTAAAPESRPRRAALALVAAACVAALAGIWQAVMMSTPTNDDFLHLALAQHLLAGDVPVRDFFDNGLVLQFTLSAVSQAVVGHRLLSEAIVVGTAWAVSTWAAFWVVRRLTGSTFGGVIAAVLLIVSSPRGYSYPKVIVYAVAAALWWAYVSRPTWGRLAALGAWAGVAFYWRPDHGAYVAIGVILAALAAHEPRAALVRSVAAGCVALAVTGPFFLLAHQSLGLREYMATGFAQAGFQHEGGHEWPHWPLRAAADFVRVDAAEVYAPRIAIRWTSGSSAADREAVLRRYGLSVEASDGPDSQQVRLSDRSLDALRGLINEPTVEDTAGLDRGTATIPWSRWAPWERVRFDYTPMRLRILPGLDEHTRASEAVAAIFYLLPVLFLALAVPFRRFLTPHAGIRPLLAFGIFAGVVTLGLLRTPYDVRGVDGVAIAAILFGICAVLLWRAAAERGSLRRSIVSAATVLFVLVTLKSVAVAGQLSDRAGWLAGEWRSAERLEGAWREVYARLVASPPLRFYEGRDAGVSARLAEYANACLLPSERLLVLWFAPEIYYYAGRLAAQRHLVFVPGWAGLAHEQRMTLAMAERFSPPLAFAGPSLEGVALETYPGLVKYVRREYDLAGSIGDGDEVYTVFARRDRPAVRTYGDDMWPCYR